VRRAEDCGVDQTDEAGEDAAGTRYVVERTMGGNFFAGVWRAVTASRERGGAEWAEFVALAWNRCVRADHAGDGSKTRTNLSAPRPVPPISIRYICVVALAGSGCLMSSDGRGRVNRCSHPSHLNQSMSL